MGEEPGHILEARATVEHADYDPHISARPAMALQAINIRYVYELVQWAVTQARGYVHGYPECEPHGMPRRRQVSPA